MSLTREPVVSYRLKHRSYNRHVMTVAAHLLRMPDKQPVSFHLVNMACKFSMIRALPVQTKLEMQML